MTTKEILNQSSSWSRLLRLTIVAIIALTSLASQAGPTSAQSVSGDPTSVEPRFDLTGDGRVTYADVMEVVLSWSALDAQGASCAKRLRTPGHDLDGDGCITIFDVQLVSARIGGVTNAARASAFEDAISALAAGPLTMTVNSTGDAVDANPGDAVCSTSGNVCTLRAAVMEANARPGAENIHFNIPGSGVREIRLYSDLPTISDQTGAVVIDGFTQPGSSPNTNAITQGSNAIIRVQIVGNGNSGPSAFRISSSNNVIRGLALYSMYRKVWIAGAQADNNVISGNYIGINAAGTGGATSSYGGAFGVTIQYAAQYNRIGGSTPADRSVISGNGDDGIDMDSPGTEHNMIYGCIVGLSPNGSTRIRNRSDGIDINNGTSYTIIGGLAPGERNVISGNASEGIEISHSETTSHNQVIGNFVGTNLTGNGGSASIHRNPGFGVSLEDRASYNIVGPGNVIANNGRGGMEAYGPGSTGNVIYENKIGVDVSDKPLPNIGWGIRLRYHASNVTIGPDNIIANNTTHGVLINDGNNKFNTITRNSIYNNGGLGIDIDPIGVNQNDQYSHSGANGRQNFPVITSATATEVRGTACAGCVVEIFLADSPAGSYGEGKTFLASAVASSTGIFTIPLSGVTAGQVITSTATAPDRNTSEFSLNVALTASVTPQVPGTIQAEDYTDASDSTPGNTGGVYRAGDVDIQTCTDATTPNGQQCYNVGWTDTGEWLEYSVSIQNAGWYAFTMRATAANNNRKFHIELNGQNLSGTVTVPNTGGYGNWTDVPVPPIQLPAGNHALRIVIENGGFNFNYLKSVATTARVNNPPSVAIDTPANGQSVSGNVVIDVAAPDDQTAPADLDVEVSIDGGSWQDATWSSASNRYELTWDASNAAPGQHTIAARATDSKPQTTVAAPVTVTIEEPVGLTIPGRIEIEDYTTALDNTTGNTGNVYRNGDVDIQACSDPQSPGACYNIGWTESGEWLAYDLTIQSAGYYAFTIRYATPSSGRSVRLELDNVAITNPILLPNSGGYQIWASATTEAISLPAGSHTLKLLIDSTNVNLNFIEASATTAPPPPPAPTVPNLPGTIEAEAYNNGGEGVGYHDLTPGNTGNLFRSDDVDIEVCSDPTSSSPCYDVGWTETGEWLAYDVNVPTAGNFVFTIRYATPSSTPRRVRIEIDGVDATGLISLPSTGGYQVWGNASSIPVAIPAGPHTIKLIFDRGGPNINYIAVTAS